MVNTKSEKFVIKGVELMRSRRATCRRISGVAAVVLIFLCSSATAGAAGRASYPLIQTLPTATDLKSTVPPNVQQEQKQDHLSVVALTTTPNGTLSPSGVLAVLGHGGAFQSAFLQSRGGVGANVAYGVSFGGTVYYGVLGIKFPSTTAGKYFAQQVVAILTAGSGAQVLKPSTYPPQFAPLKVGVLPTSNRVILQVPSASVGIPPGPSVVSQMLFSDGSYYLLSTSGLGTGNLSELSNMVIALRGCRGHSKSYLTDGFHCP
jgi:hypothetical protein